eukprot:TRINITY_DN6425_c0_g2_i1.p1 TRINITY_DN6425_c0_g2~~TRINITY_DN6425_c0_g2_i1.p1  ORF type:complete len:589 (-),score=137.95 TRINITY_DN6425_c0_g2_i1:35-1801(-)
MEVTDDGSVDREEGTVEVSNDNSKTEYESINDDAASTKSRSTRPRRGDRKKNSEGSGGKKRKKKRNNSVSLSDDAVNEINEIAASLKSPKADAGDRPAPYDAGNDEVGYVDDDEDTASSVVTASSLIPAPIEYETGEEDAKTTTSTVTTVDEDEEREPTEEEKREAMIKHRNSVAREILETENSYVTSLQMLLDMYISPLRKSIEKGDPIIGEEDLKAIFSTVELIYNLNKTLLSDIEKRLSGWTDSTLIGDIFLQFAPMFKLYSDYVKNYGGAMVHLQNLTERSRRFANFLKDAAAVNRQVLGIHTFLIMPVQRLPRYILLITDLKKHTPEEHPDRNNLSKAAVIFQQVTDQVNMSIKIAENINKIVTIQNSLLGKINLVDPARKFIKEGLLTKITSRFIKECMFYLFNDILIYTYPMPMGYYQHKGTILLGPSWIRDLKDTSQVKNSFQIVSKNKTYTMYATTPEIKHEWMTAIQEQIDHLVQLQPDLINQRSDVKVRQRGGLWKLIQKGLSYSIEEFDSEAANQNVVSQTTDQTGGNWLKITTDKPPNNQTPLLPQLSNRVGLFQSDDNRISFYDGGYCCGCTIS